MKTRSVIFKWARSSRDGAGSGVSMLTSALSKIIKGVASSTKGFGSRRQVGPAMAMVAISRVVQCAFLADDAYRRLVSMNHDLLDLLQAAFNLAV